jgi:hypothetical protein
MNPNSSFYVSFNMGYPNAYDRSHGRTGAHLMVHGACSSAGCYSMTDDQIGELYALVREAHNGGQRAVQMQAFPFRMTPENLAKHRLDPNIAFWKNLKEGSDFFEVAKDEPSVSVAGGRYAFNRDGSQIDSSITQAIAAKRQQDEIQVAALVSKGTPAVKLIYDDGDQHSSFKRMLAQSGADSMNKSVAWGSRDVGISRVDSLIGPRVVVLDDKGRTKATVRAESAENEAVLAAVSSAQAEEAKPVIAAAPAKPAAQPAKAASDAATQVAKATPGAATPAPIQTASAEPAQPSFYQRALSFVPLLGSGSSEPKEQAPIASTVPETPQTVTAPLPPRAGFGPADLAAAARCRLCEPAHCALSRSAIT